MVKRFWRGNHSGMYFSVVEEGEVEPGDEIQLLHRDSIAVSILDVVRLYKGETHDEDLLRRVLQSPLRGSWKQGIEETARQATLL
jgi:MOSC domain-containing protein YiiM